MVAGFPGSIGTRPALLEATCRTLSGKRAVEPVPLLPEQVLSEGSYAYLSGMVSAMEPDTTWSLFALRVRSYSNSPGPEGTVLVLQAGNKQFLGIIPDSKADPSLNL